MVFGLSRITFMQSDDAQRSLMKTSNAKL